MVASFQCCGTSPPFHTSTRMARKRSRMMGSAGSSILSNSTSRESGPGAFQLCIPRIARLVSYRRALTDNPSPSSVSRYPVASKSPRVKAHHHQPDLPRAPTPRAFARVRSLLHRQPPAYLVPYVSSLIIQYRGGE